MTPFGECMSYLPLQTSELGPPLSQGRVTYPFVQWLLHAQVPRHYITGDINFYCSLVNLHISLW